MNLLERIQWAYRHGGCSWVQAGKWGVRMLSPIVKQAERNNVKMPLELMPEKLFDEKLGLEVSDPYFEGGIMNCHRKLTRKGDQVIIIGGGYGVSAINASRIVGPQGRVIVYEGSEKQVDFIKKTMEINNICSEIDVRCMIVGEPKSLFGSEDGCFMPPAELEECDVLELDCEGSELGILRTLQIRPRVLIVEVHPWLFDEGDSPCDLFHVVDVLGYKIVDVYDHNPGRQITSKEEMRRLLDISRITNERTRRRIERTRKRRGKASYSPQEDSESVSLACRYVHSFFILHTFQL